MSAVKTTCSAGEKRKVAFIRDSVNTRIPASSGLFTPNFAFNLRGELQLEKKSDMKRRGLASPDIADALALTYARPVFPRAYDNWMSTGNNVVSEYVRLTRPG